MNSQSSTATDSNRLSYSVDENPGNKLSASLGLQAAVLMISGIALTPVIVLRGADADPSLHGWVIFAALLVSGVTTWLQGRPFWILGSGYALFMGTSGAFIAVGIAAVQSGGLSLLATLAAVSALFQFAFAARLHWFRRVITPEVGGVVVMLIVVTVFPICANLMNDVSPEHSDFPAAATAGVTFLITTGLALLGRGKWRLWGPFIGLVAGCSMAAAFDLFSVRPIISARWIGLPETAWPGMDLSFGAAFWALLPGFVIVTLVGAIETYGDAISIQSVSHRQRKPIDFRVIQKALYTDGLGNFLSGMLGTLPNTTYSTSISLVEFTGVAARRVAMFGGIVYVILAFFPKISALLQVIPNPVVGAYLLVLLAILFISGLRLVAEGGLDYEKGLIVSLSFWVGIAFQNQMVFPELLTDWMHALLDNGMTAGGLCAMILNGLMAIFQKGGDTIWFSPSRHPFPMLRAFIRSQGQRAGWSDDAIQRCELVGEEALLYLRNGVLTAKEKTRLSIVMEKETAHLEFSTGVETPNLAAEIQSLEPEPVNVENEAGLRILRAMAATVNHQQFGNRSFLMLSVASSDRENISKHDDKDWPLNNPPNQ